MTLVIYTSRSFVHCNLFQMGCFAFAKFLLTSASRSPSSLAELLVFLLAHPVGPYVKSVVLTKVVYSVAHITLCLLLSLSLVYNSQN